MIAIIIVIACLVVVVGLLGILVLAGLASGESGPRRFAVSEPTSASGLFTGATWAATVSVEVARPAAQVWKQAAQGPFVAFGPLIRGPEARGDHRLYRGLIAAASRTIESTPDTAIVAVGTGISIPLVVKSFAERVVLTGRREGTSTNIEYTLAVQPRFFGFVPLRWTAVFVRPFMAAAIKRSF